MSLYKPKAVYAASERNALQQVVKFKCIRWYLRVTEGGARRLMHGLLKLTQFCVSFIVLWSQNGRFQKPQRCQFLNRSLFRSLTKDPDSWVMTEIILSQGQAVVMGF